MQLRELQYVIALAKEGSFVRAAAKCFVSQPALSVAIKNIEEELGVTLFERGKSKVSVTVIGEKIVAQAQRVLDETQALKDLAQGGRNPLSGVLRLGAIYTIAPYVLPQLIGVLAKVAPEMPIEIEENFTHSLESMLRQSQIDCALVALPFDLPGLIVDELYEEPFLAVVPQKHEWAARKEIDPRELSNAHCILLSVGNCFRNHVLQSCPELNHPSSSTTRSNSLETARNMVASGLGVSVMPASALSPRYASDLVRAIEFTEPKPSRRVGIAYRAGYARQDAIDLIKRSIRALPLDFATPLNDQGAVLNS